MEPDLPASQRLAARGFGLHHDPWDRLVLIDAEGVRHVGVEPIRAFPLSEPTRWVSLCDAEGREIVFIEDLDGLPAPARRVLEGDLARREFLPTLLRIVRASTEATPADWEVETDRGPTHFTVDNEDDVRHLGPHRALITDSHGLRYLVPDTRALDPHSRRILERYL